MALYSKQSIGLGTVPNDDTGDDLRAGGDKINDNNDEVFGAVDYDAGGAKVFIFEASGIAQSQQGIKLGGTVTANLLNDYEEGTWSPTQAGVTLTVGSASFTKIGRLVTITFDITWPTTSDTTAVALGGLPFTPNANSGSGLSGFTTFGNIINAVAGTTGILFHNKGGVPSSALQNVDLSTRRVIMSLTYET